MLESGRITPAVVDAIAVEATRLLQSRTAQVLNAIDDGIFCLGHDGSCIFVNEAAVRILGFTNREMLGRSMHALTHHHYADGTPFPVEACPILSSVTDGVQQRVGGDTFWTKAGAPVIVDYTSIPLKEGRSVVGVVVTFRDAGGEVRAEQQTVRLQQERSARLEAEGAREALRASEAHYRFLAESIPVQLWTAAPDGTLDFATARGDEFFGTGGDAMLRMGWQDVVHPDDLPETKSRWEAAVRSGEPYEMRFRLRAADGGYRWFLARALAQRDERGEVVRWFGANTDIHDVIGDA